VVNPRTNELTTVNAGHMAPILRRHTGMVEEIGEEASGLPLGVMSGYEYSLHTHVLEQGDVVTIFTDGFSEAMNAQRELYTVDRLKRQIMAPVVDVVDFGQHILEDVSRFVDGFNQVDDMCLVCFGREQEGSERSHREMRGTKTGGPGDSPASPIEPQLTP
jgi:serine phosphatase RsbU (regulator of sigma subunit)